MSTEPVDRREATIRALRECADFLEAHPDVPTPQYGTDFTVFPDDAADVDEMAEALGVEPSRQGGHYVVRLAFTGGWTGRGTPPGVSIRGVYVSPEARAEYNATMSYRGAVSP